MKAKPQYGPTGRALALRCRRMMMGLWATVLLPAAAGAQGPFYNTQVHELRDPAYPHFDVRGFSTEIVPGSTGNTETVMAGTIYDGDNHFGRPVFLHNGDNRRRDKLNGANITYPDPLPGYGGRPFQIYNDANFYDQHVADIAVGTPSGNRTIYYITCGVRESYTPSTPNARDKIKVLAVDKDGALQNVFNGNSSMVIQDVSANGNLSKGLYPMHSIYKAHVPDGAGNYYDLLYICGYVTLANYGGTTTPPIPVACIPVPCPAPYYPGYEERKQAFVMTVDVNTGNVMNAKYYDYTYTAPGGPVEPFDFDIAMRLTPLSDSLQGSGQIHVTGSVNAVTGQGNATSVALVRSATMNMTIDQWTLNIGNRGHFISAGNVDGWGTSEYGIGVVERTYTDPALPSSPRLLSNCYVVSNVYTGLPGNGPGNSYARFYPPTPGGFPELFNFKPDHMTVTHVTGTMQPSVSRQKISSTCWGVQVLPSPYLDTPYVSSTNHSDARFMIAGMTYRSLDSINDTYPASMTNIQPFLMHMKARTNVPVSAGGGTTIVDMTARTFSNQTGTVSATGHDYLKMRHNLSDILWGPTFAATASKDMADDIVLNAPRAAKTGGTMGGTGVDYFLGLKTIFKEKNLGGWNCVAITFTPPTSTSEAVERYNNRLPSAPVMTEIVVAGNVRSTPGTTAYVDPVVHNRYGDCLGSSSFSNPPGSPVFKQTPTGVTPVTAATVTSVRPNPAKEEVFITLARNIEAGAAVKVVLVNLQGQLVGNLYEGNAASLSPATRLQLPQLPAGLYLLQVYSNKVVVHQQKLGIQ